MVNAACGSRHASSSQCRAVVCSSVADSGQHCGASQIPDQRLLNPATRRSGHKRRVARHHGRCPGRSTAASSWAPLLAVLLLLGGSAPSAVLSQPATAPAPTALAPAPGPEPGARGGVTVGSFVPTAVLAGPHTIFASALRSCSTTILHVTPHCDEQCLRLRVTPCFLSAEGTCVGVEPRQSP